MSEIPFQFTINEEKNSSLNNISRQSDLSSPSIHGENGRIYPTSMKSSGLGEVPASKAYIQAMRNLQERLKECEESKRALSIEFEEKLREKEEQIMRLEVALGGEKEIFSNLEKNLMSKLRQVEREKNELLRNFNIMEEEAEKQADARLQEDKRVRSQNLEQINELHRNNLTLKQEKDKAEQINEELREEVEFLKKILVEEREVYEREKKGLRENVLKIKEEQEQERDFLYRQNRELVKELDQYRREALLSIKKTNKTASTNINSSGKRTGSSVLQRSNKLEDKSPESSPRGSEAGRHSGLRSSPKSQGRNFKRPEGPGKLVGDDKENDRIKAISQFSSPAPRKFQPSSEFKHLYNDKLYDRASKSSGNKFNCDQGRHSLAESSEIKATGDESSLSRSIFANSIEDSSVSNLFGGEAVCSKIEKDLRMILKNETEESMIRESQEELSEGKQAGMFLNKRGVRENLDWEK